MVSLKNQEIDFDYGTLQLAVKMICFFFFFLLLERSGEAWSSYSWKLSWVFFVFVFFS